MSKYNSSLVFALLGLLSFQAEARKTAEDASFAYRYSAYTEANVIEELADLSQLPANAQDYELASVGLHQFRLQLPMGQRLQLDFDVKTAIISGNMVEYLRPEGAFDQNTDVSNRQPVAVLTENNVSDERTEFAGTMNYFFDDVAMMLKAQAATEDDYSTLNVGGKFSFEFNGDNTVFTIGADYSMVDVEPLDQNGNPDVARNDEKTLTKGFLELSHIFTPKFIALFGVEGAFEDGYLADPYRKAYVHALFDVVDDTRPRSRTAVTTYLKSRYFIEFAGAALHTDYRFHFDNWEMTSHTFELGWHQGVDDFLRIFDGGSVSSRIKDLWDVAVSVRYHTQTKAEFYEHFFIAERDDGYYTSDPRLSNFGAVSFALRATRQFTNWKLFVGVENYFSDLAFAAVQEEDFESPALTDWNVFQIGVELKFK